MHVFLLSCLAHLCVESDATERCARLAWQSERQTVLYSATMPADLRSIASLAMDEDYKVVDCVGDEEETHGNVPQR